MEVPAKPHTLSVRDALIALSSTGNGLDTQEASARLLSCGPNHLPTTRKRHPLLRFLAQLQNALIYVLLGSAVITAALGHMADTAVIFAVVVANAIIGFIQEDRAEQAMSAVRQMLSQRTSLLRDGKRISIDSAELVPGDIVLLEAGNRIPADLRLLEVSNLRTEEAVLTGESVPVEKFTQPVEAETPLGDRSCMAFSGTFVTTGTGRGLVVATGAKTEIGKISKMLAQVEPLRTPLTRQMDRFARWLTASILLIAAILLVYGFFFSHLPFVELFMAVVGLSVAAIPEGLPAILTITLAVGVRAMAKRHAIVRRLPAIETLGSVSVICTDKTGTLTRNEMMLATVATGGHVYSVSGQGYAPEGKIFLGENPIDAAKIPPLIDLARAACLCNDAALYSDASGWKVEGDPMEGALLAFGGKVVTGGSHAFSAWVQRGTIPFDSQARYMATLHWEQGDQALIHVKGAPERVLAMCTAQVSTDGRETSIDTDHWIRQAEEIAKQGQRVLALAQRAVTADRIQIGPVDLDGKLVLLGLVGLIDPPRREAIDAVAECHRAGIRVKMITGDHAGTAVAVARQLGLQNPDQALTGTDIEGMTDGELAASAQNVDVFARTSPEHKLRLVTALQSRGMTVAMTGDGVNDAPALKRADAGVAMGHKGSEAAKEAADIVLVDDNFASIADAIQEGRTAYDNIKKVISWTLPTGAGEATTVVVALLFKLALPVTAIQILWVNLVTAITLGLALAFEPTESGTMRQPPRAREEPLLSMTLTWHIVFVSALFLVAVFGLFAYATHKGYSIRLARTLALNLLVVLEIFHLLFIHNIYGASITRKALRGTPSIWFCVTAVIAAQLAVTYLPFMHQIFDTAPLPLPYVVLLIVIGLVFFAIIETEKQLRIRLLRNHPSKSGH